MTVVNSKNVKLLLCSVLLVSATMAALPKKVQKVKAQKKVYDLSQSPQVQAGITTTFTKEFFTEYRR